MKNTDNHNLVTIDLMVALADTLKRRDRLDLAEDLHHRAIELQVKVSGKSDLTTLTLKLNLAELLRRRSKVDG